MSTELGCRHYRCHAATELYCSVFRPTVHREIYSFDDVPRALREMHDNVQTGIPIIRVAERMPAAVSALISGAAAGLMRAGTAFDERSRRSPSPLGA